MLFTVDLVADITLEPSISVRARGEFMTNPFRLALALVLTVNAVLSADFAYAEPATDQTIREYLRVSGEEEKATVAMKNLVPQIRQLLKTIPDDLLSELTKTETAVASLLPIYRKHFSEEELRGFIEFYRTPLGAKLAKSLSEIQQEAMALGAKQAQAVVGNYYIQKGKFAVEQQRTVSGK